MEIELKTIIESWQEVINNFKKRSDVISGFGLAWKGNLSEATIENTPYAIGDGLGTTGWCVSASQALLYDSVFQLNLRYRNAKAKLVSIDLKEQYHGHCYNGSQNKWHTAILLEESDYGINLIIDITCRQFGNEFINMDIWTIDAWVNKLRSPLCKHSLTDFQNKQISIVPLINSNNIYLNTDLKNTDVFEKLKNIISLDDNDRNFLTNFVVSDIHEINKKLIIGNIEHNDIEQTKKLNELLINLPFEKLEKGYTVLKFDSKQSLKNWLELFFVNGNALPNYLFVSKSVKESCLIYGYDINELNVVDKFGTDQDPCYLIIEYSNIYSVDSSSFMDNTELLLVSNSMFQANPNNLYNTGTQIQSELKKKTNTVCLPITGLKFE